MNETQFKTASAFTIVSESSFVVFNIVADVFQLQSFVMVPHWFRLCYCH